MDETLTIRRGDRELRRMLRVVPTLWWLVPAFLVAGMIIGPARGHSIVFGLWVGVGCCGWMAAIIGGALGLRWWQARWTIALTADRVVVRQWRRRDFARGQVAAALVGYLTTRENPQKPQPDVRQVVLTCADGSIIGPFTIAYWPEGALEHLVEALGLRMEPMTAEQRRRFQPWSIRHRWAIGIGVAVGTLGLILLAGWLGSVLG